MENNILTYSSSPHVKNPRTTKNIMLDVCIALLPACIMGIIFFKGAWLVLLLSSVSAVASEFVYYLIMGKNIKQIAKAFDYSSLVTGLLLGMVLGSQSPWYVPVLGSIFAIVVVKCLFGGTGKNLVNPAIAGRIFVFMSFASVITGGWALPRIGLIGGGEMLNPETGATFLTNMFDAQHGALLNISNLNLNLFLGTGIAGCIGETCKLALLVGGLYLACRKVINLLFPTIYIVVTGLFSVCLGGFDFNLFLPSILSGGLFLGAIFMATDYVTSPNTLLGNIIYFVLLGLITAGLRFATKIEVVSFVILLMNIVVPLIDKFIFNKPFGAVKCAKKKGA